MSTIYTHQSANVRKTWFIMSAFFIFVMFVGWIFGQAMQSPAIFYIVTVIAIGMNVASYWWSDKLVLKMTGAKEVQKSDAPELYRLVENLSIAAGLPMPKVYVINDPAPNAFATGRDERHAVVAVTTGLLERLEKQELEGVLAHELSHIGNKDMLVSTIAVVLVGLVVMLADMFRHWTWFGGGNHNGNRDGRAQLIFFVVAIVLSILAPLFAMMLQLAISRKREFLADASGALLTRYPEGLASALLKISQAPQEMRRANHATAHLFIANPFKPKNGVGFMTKLFMTHPPIEDRVRALRGMSL